MNKKSITIITSDIRRQNAFAFALEKNTELTLCECYRNRYKIIDLLRENKPDIILTDALMPFVNIFSFIKQVREAFLTDIKIIVMVAVDEPSYILKLINAGADHCIMAPESAENIIEEISDFLNIGKNELLEGKITMLLKSLNFQPQTVGFKSLIKMIQMCYENPDRLKCVSKKLYPAMEKELKIKTANIEHSIRHSIQNAWNVRNDAVWSKYFANTNYKPTNKEFAAAICNELKYG